MAPNLLATFKELLLVLAGGLCAAFGGLVSTWYRAKKAGEIKMAETIGLQKVEAYKKALSFISGLRGVLIQGTNEDALQFITEHGQWFSDNIILLPHNFVENWISIRSNLRKAILWNKSQRKMPDGPERTKMIEKLVELASFMDELAGEAEKEIRNKLGLPEVKIRRPPESKKS